MMTNLQLLTNLTSTVSNPEPDILGALVLETLKIAIQCQSIFEQRHKQPKVAAFGCLCADHFMSPARHSWRHRRFT